MKKIILCIFVFILPINSYAAIQDTLNTMFMSNATPPGAINTPNRSGYSMGTFAVRAPIKAINLVAFDPPRLSAGCGGLDMYGGSFSFINADQFTALVRQIMANALGLLFQAALKSINPMIADLVNYFQDVVNGLNKMMSNTCAIAHQLTDKITDTDSAQDSMEKKWSQYSATINTSSDSFKKAFGPRAEKETDAPVAENDPAFTTMGNMTWRALMRTKAADALDFPATDDEKTMMLMSMVGTQILTSTDAPNTVSTVTAGNASSQNDTPATLRAVELVNESRSTKSIIYLKCYPAPSGGSAAYELVGGEMGCPVVKLEDLQFSGTYPYVLNMLYGDPAETNTDTIILNSWNYSGGAPHANSIVAKINTGTISTLTTAQRQFFYIFPAPIANILRNAQSDRNSLSMILTMVSKYAAIEMALRIAQAASTASKFAWHKVPIPKSKIVVEGENQIKADIVELLKMRDLEQAKIKLAVEMSDNIIRGNPNVPVSVN